MLAQSLLSSKRWEEDELKGESREVRDSDSETDSLDEMNFQRC